jgi:hypothetical protein
VVVCFPAARGHLQLALQAAIFAQNKPGIGVPFSSLQKRASKYPRLPRTAPRFHHDFTITKTQFSQNHPQKHQQNKQKLPHHQSEFF